ncbi:FHA domain-containing protein [Jannaschia rubra]|uniref:FHA domain-containing protein n=1 Tax=Jannaschia rubra TaxID=282197 RepID=A0A0M6XR24_9RHOB|nr:FHA domain-containing protein [Jannaschia rubra]CTQ33162.1 hypothetical protein JAN5088_01942 [Jannaschia rubra]SFG79842.1 hypothetical protein SAMN04488517_11624 [Jannaschia rubra]
MGDERHIDAVMERPEATDELPPGTRLLHGQYRIDSFLDAGGVWDIDDGEDDDDALALDLMARVAGDVARDRGATLPPGALPLPPCEARPGAPARSRRPRTRLLGFDGSGGDAPDPFRGAPPAEAPARARFPVGRLLVVEGPGRGECFVLTQGMSQIGRGHDQTVQLDFGDTAISRSNHAAVVHDGDTRSFLPGHGGKSDIVRLNARPVIANEVLSNGDLIRLGETVLRLVTLCGSDFDWSDGAAPDDAESDDVAIA